MKGPFSPWKNSPFNCDLFSGRQIEQFRQYFRRIAANPVIAATLEFNSVEAIKQCVMSGVGITMLPEIAVAREIAQGRLTALPWEEGEMEVALLMIRYKERWLSPTLSAFVKMARDAYLPFNGP